MSIGTGQDVVEIRFGGKTATRVESYEIHTGLLTQPGAFAIRMGDGGSVADLVKQVPPNTPFELLIDGKPQLRGRTDGFTVAQTGGGSEITIRGRDRLAPLHDAYLRSELSITDATFAELTEKALNATVGDHFLVYDNDANRKAVTGARGSYGGDPQAALIAKLSAIDFNILHGEQSLKAAFKNQDDLQKAIDAYNNAPAQAPAPNSQRTIQGKLGEKWLEGLLKPELDRAGLFLWCGADGTDAQPFFVLTAPATKQSPHYRILRKRGTANNAVTVLEATWKHETTSRYSSAEVHFRRGGGAEGRSKGFGLFVDEEMTALGYDRPYVHKDAKCKGLAQANYLARKHLTDGRRAGWQLVYKVAGHTVEGVRGERTVWAFDTIVDIDDDELDIHGPHYIESVVHACGPEKTTTLTMMRPEDVLFGDPNDDGSGS